MLLHPAVIGLIWCSALVCCVAVVAAAAGVSVAVGWSPDDSGRRQLARERRALLVESALVLVLAWQLVSLFLFILTADRLHTVLPGAMCAAGTLSASPLGYPTLLVKAVVFLMAGIGLVVIRSSADAWATGLVRAKYLSMAGIAGVVVVENVIQIRYFADLDPELVTSCCAAVFGRQAAGLGGDLAAVPAALSKSVLVGGLATTLGAGARFLVRGRSPALFAAQVVPLGAVAVVAIVSWIAPAFYELPTHHCPFCLLSWRYGCVGHLLFATLAVALVAGSASGVLHRLRVLDRFGSIRPRIERRLCATSMAGFLAFSLIALWPSLIASVRAGGQ